MKSIQKICQVLAILAVVTLIFTVGTACGAEKKSEIEMFYSEKESVSTLSIENLVLVNTKNIVQKTLVNNNITVKDIFIRAYTFDGECCIYANVLTENNEYKVFRIRSEKSGPLYTALTKGYAGNYQKDLETYLSGVHPTLDGENICFD